MQPSLFTSKSPAFIISAKLTAVLTLFSCTFCHRHRQVDGCSHLDWDYFSSGRIHPSTDYGVLVFRRPKEFRAHSNHFESNLSLEREISPCVRYQHRIHKPAKLDKRLLKLSFSDQGEDFHCIQDKNEIVKPNIDTSSVTLLFKLSSSAGNRNLCYFKIQLKLLKRNSEFEKRFNRNFLKMSSTSGNVTTMKMDPEDSCPVSDDGPEDTCGAGDLYHGFRRKHRFLASVDVRSSKYSISKRFLSVALGGRITQRFGKRPSFDLDSPKLQALAKALTPCGLRVGGSFMMVQLFSPDGTKDSLVDPQTIRDWEKVHSQDFYEGYVGRDGGFRRYLFTGEQWDAFYGWIEKVGWELLYDFSNWITKDGEWDTTNAKLFLDYSSERGMKVSAFQVGNEPHIQGKIYGISITPEQVVQNYKALRELTQQYSLYKDSILVGPDSGPEFFRDFLKEGGNNFVDFASFHQYYGNGRTATVSDFLNPKILNKFHERMVMMTEVRDRHFPQMKISIPETASFYGGGAQGMSNRYASGFLWLNKLGMSAEGGIAQVYRQNFFSGAAYSMIDSKTYQPNPDYYLSVLYKRLVEGPVYKATFSPHSDKLRLHVNRARTDTEYGYPEGSLVFYYLNLDDEDMKLTLTQFRSRRLDLFQLTPGEGGLESAFVKLNGQTLEMVGDELPPMEPKSHEGEVTLPAQSFGFIVVPEEEHTWTNSCWEAVKKITPFF